MSQAPGKLERRARALLRAYPAEYRHGRAEEIIATVLEAAPPGRSFTAAREAWSLILGGRHARAARNRRPGVRTNVRLALLLGISTYLGFAYSLMFATLAWEAPGGGASWLTNAEVAAGAATALAPWLGSRAATTALAVLAGTFYAYDTYRELSAAHGYATMAPAANVTITVRLLEWLVVLAALAALSGVAARLPRSWLWVPCAFPSRWWRDACCTVCLTSPAPPLIRIPWCWARWCCWRSSWPAGSPPTPAPRSPSASHTCFTLPWPPCLNSLTAIRTVS